jgi:hypothetical protein
MHMMILSAVFNNNKFPRFLLYRECNGNQTNQFQIGKIDFAHSQRSKNWSFGGGKKRFSGKSALSGE